MIDCSASDPGHGLGCYIRPEYEITAPAAMPGVVDTVKYACESHIGEVLRSFLPWDNLGAFSVTVTEYEGD